MSDTPSYDELDRIAKRLGGRCRTFAGIDASLKQAHEQRLRFERLLTELSAAFVNIPADAVDSKVEEVLQRIGEMLGVDRTDFIQLVKESGQVEITHSWTAEGIERYPRTLTRKHYPWFTESLPKRPAMLFSVEELPEEALRDKQSFEKMGIKSGLIIPYMVDGAFVCATAFGCHRNYRIPLFKENIHRLNLLGEIIFNALRRKQADLELRNAFFEIQTLKNQLEEENVNLHEEIEATQKYDEIIGESDGIKRMLKDIQQVAKTDSTVLILGETGTGKELVARAIHKASARRKRPLITVNSAALPASLVESELFGRKKGAYTGAISEQMGRFEAADGSTIFLDEIGEMPLELQPKLLRVLQEGQFEKLGNSKTISVDVRVIAATNQDLKKNLQAGKFRQDLYYRLNVFPIRLPPLRERREDILSLTWAFIEEFGDAMGKRIESISPKSVDAIQRHLWPGNVRELRNVVERAMIICKGKTLTIDTPRLSDALAIDELKLEEYHRRYLLHVLEKAKWRIRGKKGAAELAGLKPTTLYTKMKKLGIKRPD